MLSVIQSTADISSLMSLALQAFEHGKPEQALAMLQRVIQQQTPESEVFAFRAEVHKKLRQFPDAISDLCRAALLSKNRSHYLLEALTLLQQIAPENRTPTTLNTIKNALFIWLQEQPEQTLEPKTLSCLAWLQTNGYLDKGIGAIWKSGHHIQGWACGLPDEDLMCELDGHLVPIERRIATAELQRHGLGNGCDGFQVQLPADFSLCRLGIGGRSLWGSPLTGSRYLKGSQPAKAPFLPTNTCIDVLIPVYAGLDEVVRCLNAVKRAKNHASHRVIVINDHSADPILKEELRQRARAKDIVLLERPFNVGFVGAINTGLNYSTTNDVVLLNADTVVADYWLDGLKKVADSHPNIGTVTPMTNNGELLSYPLAMTSNTMPDARQLKRLNHWFAEFGTEEAIDLPTGVGFCLYIRRNLLNAIGGLDEALIIRGYGEETEFCLRAAAQGWRNVAATQVFVAHEGGIAFGEEKKLLAQRNIAIIKARYADHGDKYQQFLDHNPIDNIKRKVARADLKSALSRQNIGCELHDSTSYTATGFLAQKRSACALILAENSLSPDRAKLVLHLENRFGTIHINYLWPQQQPDLWEDLGLFQQALDLRTIARWPLELLSALTQTFAYTLSPTDYSLYCPRRYLLQDQARYCGDPAKIATCRTCVAQHGPLVLDFDTFDAWYQRRNLLLAGASQIRLPNAESAQRHQRHFPEYTFQSEKHAPVKKTKQTSSTPTLHRIAVPSALYLHQGYRELITLAKRAAQNNGMLRFIVFGETFDDELLLGHNNIELLGPIPASQILATLSEYRCHAIVDLTPMPGSSAWCELAHSVKLPLLDLAALKAMIAQPEVTT